LEVPQFDRAVDHSDPDAPGTAGIRVRADRITKSTFTVVVGRRVHSGGVPVDRSTSDVNRDDMVLRPSRRPPDTERDPTNGGPVKLLYVSQGRHRLIDDDALFGDASERVVSPQNLCSF